LVLLPYAIVSITRLPTLTETNGSTRHLPRPAKKEAITRVKEAQTFQKAKEIRAMSIHKLTRSLEHARKRAGSEVQVTTLLTFLYIAQKPKCSQVELEQDLGLTNASASRNVSYWTSRRADRQPGLGFVERVEDDYDRRIKQLTLTPLGRSFYTQLLELNK
jgi:DNA-binding MarR family transcriptional regulator